MTPYRCWLDVSSQFKGLLKEMKAAIGFPTAPQIQWIVITYCVFSRSISFRSEKSSRVMAALNSHQQRSAIGKNQYIVFVFKTINIIFQGVRCFVHGKSFKVICAPADPYSLCGFCSSGILTREHCFVRKQINMKYSLYSNSSASQPRP